MSDIESLSFDKKVELLKQLIDNLDIELDAAYGAVGFICSDNVSVENGTVRIWTGICTG